MADMVLLLLASVACGAFEGSFTSVILPSAPDSIAWRMVCDSGVCGWLMSCFRISWPVSAAIDKLKLPVSWARMPCAVVTGGGGGGGAAAGAAAGCCITVVVGVMDVWFSCTVGVTTTEGCCCCVVNTTPPLPPPPMTFDWSVLGTVCTVCICDGCCC